LLGAGRGESVDLREIEALGVHLGMDDFGVGNASLTNLQSLPIDFFKISASFVANLDATIARDVAGNAIVGALLELGRGLKLRTIAAGIERHDELELVREFGCRYGQGNLLGQPLTSAAFTRLRVTSRHPSKQLSHAPSPNVPRLFGLPRARADKAGL
jgi:EAL domain-containing protein (putative c-di-GMP-specific phosphodiesterase class I)